MNIDDLIERINDIADSFVDFLNDRLKLEKNIERDEVIVYMEKGLSIYIKLERSNFYAIQRIRKEGDNLNQDNIFVTFIKK